jgi:predicted phage terminase large subunit-like protein
MDQQEALEQYRQACKKSLHFLCNEVLYKDIAGGSKWGKPHDDLEKMLSRTSKRKLIMLPRGHHKTAFVTKAYSIKSLLNNPNIRILIANQVWDRARDILFEIKEQLSTKSDLPKIFGNFVSGRWREEDIVIAQRTAALSAPTIATTGVESELTSSHFDLIIADDLQGLQNSQTKDQREKVKKFLRSLTALLDPGGEMIVIGTRWHFDDMYQEILDNQSNYYDVMIRQVYEDNKIIFPEKFQMKFDDIKKDWVQTSDSCMDYIDFLKQDMGSEFYSQYMNHPVNEENQLIKKEYFKYWDRKPDGLFVALTVDPASSVEARSDYTALVVCGMDAKRNIIVLDHLKGHWGGPTEKVNNILQMVDKWHPQIIGIEGVGFQKELKYWIETQTLKERHVPPIQEIKAPPTRSKFQHMKAIEPYYRNGMVTHAKWMQNKDLENELLMLSSEGFKGKHDDLIDALAMQLDVLIPGDDYIKDEIPVGSWEYEMLEAKKAYSVKDIFHE